MGNFELFATSNEDPDPSIDVDVSSREIITGESVTVDVSGDNYGGTAGHWSSISVSSPSLDDTGDDSQVDIVSEDISVRTDIIDSGEVIKDKYGNDVTADYVLAEASTGGSDTWAAGADHSASFEFTPESTGTFVVYARVTLTDDDDVSEKFTAPESSSYTDQQKFAVERIEIEVREEANIDGRVDRFDAPSGVYKGGETASGDVTVTNTGNREHTFYVGYSFKGPNGDYYDNDGGTHESVRLSPEETEEISVNWEVPESAPGGQYDAITKLYKDADGGSLVGHLDTAREYDAITVEQIDIDASVRSLDVQSGTYHPGDTVSADVQVKNTGNVDHRFYVGYGFEGPNGDIYENDGTTHESVYLTTGETDTVTVSWTVPADGPEGWYDATTAVWEAESDGLLEGRLDSDTDYDAIEVVPNQASAEIVSFDAPAGTYRPGDTVSADVRVKNTGTLDHRFYVGYGFEGPDGDIYENDGTTHESVYLTTDETDTVTVSWTVPADAPKGWYDATTAVWEAESDGELKGRLDGDTDYDAIEVASNEVKADIVSFDAPAGTYRPGDTMSADVRVKNTGTLDHRFYVGYGFEGPDGDIYENDGTTHESVYLTAGEADTVTVSWTVPADAPGGWYDATTAVWKAESDGELQGRLDGDTDYDAIEVVPDEVDAEILSLDQPSGTFRPEGVATTEVRISNTGTVSHTYFVGYSVRGPDGIWRDNDGQTGRTVELAPEDTTTVRLRWEVAEGIPEGPYDVRVVLWQESNRDDLERELDTESEGSAFQVETNRTRAKIANVDHPSHYVPGEYETISVTVDNPGFGPETYLVSFNSETTVADTATKRVKIGSQSSETVTFDVRVPEDSGESALSVSIADASDGTQLDTVTERWNVAKTPLTVKVVADGESVDDVLVSIIGHPGKHPTNGRVTFGDVPTGKVYLLVWSDEESTDALTSEMVTVPEGGTETTIQLSNEATVSGTVVTFDGEPVENVRVEVASADADDRTNQDGSFAFESGLETRQYEFRIKDHGEVIDTRYRTLDRGDNDLRFRVSATRLGSVRPGTGSADDSMGRFEQVLTNALSGPETVRQETFEGRASLPSASGESLSPSDGFYYVEEGGAYHTSGLCAWYRPQGPCEQQQQTISTTVAQQQGMAHGFGTYTDEAVNSIVETVKNPIEYAQATINAILTIIDDIGVIEQLIDQLPKQVVEKQRADNTHKPGSEAYDAFRNGWYAGYATAFIAETLVPIGGAASKVVKYSDRLSDVTKMVRQVPRTAKSKLIAGAFRTVDNSNLGSRLTEATIKISRLEDQKGNIVRSDTLYSKYDEIDEDVLMGQKPDSNGELTGLVHEVEQVGYYAQRSERVVVEPDIGTGDPFDAKVEYSDGGVDYVEMKHRNPTATTQFDGRDLADRMRQTERKARNAGLDGTAGDRVLVFGSSRNDIAPNLMTDARFKQAIRDNYFTHVEGRTPQIDEVRLVIRNSDGSIDRRRYRIGEDKTVHRVKGTEWSINPVSEDSPALRSNSPSKANV